MKIAVLPWKDMEGLQMYVTKWKKPVWKGYILTVWFQLCDILEKAKLGKQ